MILEKSVTHVKFSYTDQNNANEAYLLINDLLGIMEEEKCKWLVVGNVTVDYDTLCVLANLLTNIDTYQVGTIK